jgi:hypothetical protein
MSQIIIVLRRASLFEIATGIFHKGRVDFVPKSVSIISLLVVFLTLFKVYMALRTYNTVDNIITKTVEEFNSDINIVKFPDASSDLGHDLFPLEVNIHDMSCNETTVIAKIYEYHDKKRMNYTNFTN